MSILNKRRVQKFIDRIADVISSDRFWYNIGIGILVGLQQNDWRTGAITALVGILGVGTIDKFGEKVGK